MRFLVFAVLAVLVTSSAWAEDNSSGNHSGGIYCPQSVPCPDSGSQLSTAALVDIANTCMLQYFGHSASGGFFDTIAGLDGNNCFTAIPGTWPRGMGSQLAPSCCVMPRPNSPGTCSMHCELDVAH